jgi:3-keto-5-aminohexanoate cleavage enzyme
VADTIDWDRVSRGLEREGHRMLWRPYGLPMVASPERSAFFEGDISPPWDIPDKMIVSVAITGAFFTHDDNPSQPLTTDEIGRQADEAASNGASTVHIHVRDDRGYNTLSLDPLQGGCRPPQGEAPRPRRRRLSRPRAQG